MAIPAKTGGFRTGLVAMVVIISPLAAHADDEGVEDDSQRCLNARSIRRTEVIDDSHIVFEIQGRRLFLNVLPKSCTGLSREGRFSFEISTRSLCAHDKIRILRGSRSAVREGRSCSLGRFQPVTYEELVEREGDREKPPAPQKVD